MYNRYIPQSDGSFRRSRIQDNIAKPEHSRQKPCPPPAPEPCRQESQNNHHCKKQSPRLPHRPTPEHRHSTAGSFLRQLLPQDFDTGDLLVVLLLLLMSGDCTEDQNTALLTLALYLFL